MRGRMPESLKPFTTLVDFVTGRTVPNVGAEENRQALERHLVEDKGYGREEIEVDVPLEFSVGGAIVRSAVDLVVTIAARRLIAIKCAAGSLTSREREILAAARILDSYQIPLAAASDGKTATVLETAAGRRIGEGLAAIPSRRELVQKLGALEFKVLAEERRQRERLIFRTYDSENINVFRGPTTG